MSHPHQQQSSSPNTSSRPRRHQRPSRRAQDSIDAGEGVPGIAPPDPLLQNSFAYQPATSANTTAPSPSSANEMSASTARRPASRKPRPSTHRAQEGADNAAAAAAAAPSLFHPATFAIYNWPIPRPTDFANLTPAQRAWKLKIDAEDRARDIDDGADDWAEFSGKRTLYPSDRRGGRALEFAIASTFRVRAKRAFWAGKSWEDFDFQERTADCGAAVRAEVDEGRKAALEVEGLGNALRLQVYDALKRRLCEEIWLEEYRDPPGLVRLAIPKRDSKFPTPVPPPLYPSQLRREQHREAPTVEEAGWGLNYWSIDSYGDRQPVFQGQDGVADGMLNFMDEMRTQAHREEAATFQRQIARGEAIVGNVDARRLSQTNPRWDAAAKGLDLGESDVEDETQD